MDIFSKLNYQNNFAQKENFWRLFYQLNTVADIFMADGRTVKPCYRTQPFQKDWHSSRQSKLNWPRQREPGDAGLRQWTKSLREGLGMNNGVFAKEYWLGKWTIDSENSESKCDQYYDLPSERLYIRTEEGYTTHAKTKAGRRIITHNTTTLSIVTTIPKKVNPVDVRKDGDTFVVTGFWESINKQPIREATTFNKYLESNEEWIQQLLFKWIAVAKENNSNHKLQSGRMITLV
jgi:hypothetical protein